MRCVVAGPHASSRRRPHAEADAARRATTLRCGRPRTWRWRQRRANVVKAAPRHQRDAGYQPGTDAAAPKRRRKSPFESHIPRNQASSPLSSSTDAAAPGGFEGGRHARGPDGPRRVDTRLAPAATLISEEHRARPHRRERRQQPFRRELRRGVGHGVAGALGSSGVVERRPDARRVERLYHAMFMVVLGRPCRCPCSRP